MFDDIEKRGTGSKLREGLYVSEALAATEGLLVKIDGYNHGDKKALADFYEDVDKNTYFPKIRDCADRLGIGNKLTEILFNHNTMLSHINDFYNRIQKEKEEGEEDLMVFPDSIKQAFAGYKKLLEDIKKLFEDFKKAHPETAF